MTQDTLSRRSFITTLLAAPAAAAGLIAAVPHMAQAQGGAPRTQRSGQSWPPHPKPQGRGR